MVVLFTSCVVALAAETSRIQIDLFDQFATFLNSDHADNRIRYRFHEHTPLTFGDVPKVGPTAKADQTSPPVEQFTNRPGAVVFLRAVTETGWIAQAWTFHLVPVADGIEILLVVKTGPIGLPESYGVQQCFRLTGGGNKVWRHKYARAPAFSEFDLWNEARTTADLPSLTRVLRDGSLQKLPAGKETVGCHLHTVK